MHNLVNIAWAFATVGQFDVSLSAALANDARQRLSEFAAQNLANTAWAFAKVGQLDAAFFAALAKETK